MRHRITFQARSSSRDDYGGQSDVWLDKIRDVPASVDPLSGRELIAAQAIQSETSHRVTMRYRHGITPSLRILFGSRIFDIEAVLNVGERDKELHLLCSEGTNKG